jgi:acyl carrier protein
MSSLEEIVYPVVDLMQNEHKALKKDPKTPLFGVDAVLDSLQLLTFIAAVEEQAQTLTGKPIPVNLDIIDSDDHALDTLGTLAAYLDRQRANTAASASR